MMDAWERLFRDEEEALSFFLHEEGIEMTAVAQTTRIIFRCNLCKHIWAHDYERNARGQLFRTWAPAPEDVNQHPISFPEYDKRCPKCHHMNVKSNEVIGTVNSRPCDERCLMATSHVCHCSCGSKNHGKGHI